VVYVVFGTSLQSLGEYLKFVIAVEENVWLWVQSLNILYINYTIVFKYISESVDSKDISR